MRPARGEASEKGVGARIEEARQSAGSSRPRTVSRVTGRTSFKVLPAGSAQERDRLLLPLERLLLLLPPLALVLLREPASEPLDFEGLVLPPVSFPAMVLLLTQLLHPTWAALIERAGWTNFPPSRLYSLEGDGAGSFADRCAQRCGSSSRALIRGQARSLSGVAIEILGRGHHPPRSRSGSYPSGTDRRPLTGSNRGDARAPPLFASVGGVLGLVPGLFRRIARLLGRLAGVGGSVARRL